MLRSSKQTLVEEGERRLRGRLLWRGIVGKIVQTIMYIAEFGNEEFLKDWLLVRRAPCIVVPFGGTLRGFLVNNEILIQVSKGQN